MSLGTHCRATNFNNVRRAVRRHHLSGLLRFGITARFSFKHFFPRGTTIHVPLCCDCNVRSGGPGCGPPSRSVLLSSTLSTLRAGRRHSSLLALSASGVVGRDFGIAGVGISVGDGGPGLCSPSGFTIACTCAGRGSLSPRIRHGMAHARGTIFGCGCGAAPHT